MTNQQVAITIPSLSDGISRQPESLRFPGQVDDATNVRFDVRAGASKRPGTMLVSEYSGVFASGQVLAMHPINRDSDERYVVVYGKTATNELQIEVFDENGTRATITSAGSAYTIGSPTAGDQTTIENYLDNTDADDIRMRTVIDNTFIINKTVATAAAATETQDVVREFRNYEEMTRHTPANDTYHRTREDSAGGNAGYWLYDADIGTFATYKLDPAGTNDWHTSAHWSNQRVGFRVGFYRLSSADTGLTFTNATKRLTKAGAFSGYVYSADDMVHITSGTGTTAGWYRVASKDSDDQISLEAVIGGTNHNNVTIGGFGREYQPEVDYTGTAPSSMQAVAEDLTAALRFAGSKDGLIEWVDDATSESGAGNGYFVITGDYRGSNAAVAAPTAPVTSTTRGITDLTGTDSGPVNRPFTSGTAIAGTGSVFIANNDDFPVASRWTRVAVPGQPSGSFDPATMPVRLVRTNTSPLTFDLQLVPWEDRLDGDQDSNPIPTPITNGESVSDILLFEGRLAMSIGEHLVFSQVDNLFNFFVEDVNNLSDDDRIVIPVGSTRVSKIKHMVPYRQTLLVFTEDGQYELQGGSNGLSPTSVSVTAATNYGVTDLEPIAMESFVYFLSERQRDTAVYEYLFNDTYASNFAQEITAHVSGYLPTGITGAASDSDENCIVLCKRGESDVYVYRAFWNGQRKVQSAWCTYDFDDNYEIADVANLAGRIYILVETGSNWRLEYLPMSEESAPTDFDYAPRIDVRLEVVPTLSAHSGTNYNIFDVDPLNAAGSTLNTLITEDGDIYTNGVNSTWTYSGTAGSYSLSSTELAVVTDGNASLATKKCILGRFYNGDLVLSRPFVRSEDGTAVIHDRVIIQSLRTDHVDSGSYNVIQVSPNRDDKITTFTPSGTTDAHGQHQHIAMADPDDTTFTIRMADMTPCTISRVTYLAESVPGGRYN